ncbi:MAG: sugar transferase [Chlorobiaceae bacterium]|nr:sugar transferase [Chlorobiaceae bacterium]MBA4310459.1 sugar transferase [Chlorobiaceae bacterium]
MTTSYFIAKRIFDIIFSLIALLVSLPIIIILIILVRLDSKGPAFFVQERAGYKGNVFRMYKFRGMVVNALDIGPDLTQMNDPRLTRVGKIIRRLSVDELPQFYNVLIGDMSIVGPRPEVLSITNLYTAEQKKVFDFKPGITGFSQINGRQTLTPEKRIEMEIEYYSNASFCSDLSIILKTPKVVLTNEGNI